MVAKWKTWPDADYPATARSAGLAWDIAACLFAAWVMTMAGCIAVAAVAGAMLAVRAAVGG